VKTTTGLGLEEAVRQALSHVVGAYGICVCSREDPDVLVAARLGSPLMLGIGEGEWFVASDASAFLEYTRQVVYLNDGEMVVIRRGAGYQVSTIKGNKLDPEVIELEGTLESIEKGGYSHFMLKEIMEQPTSLENCMRGRVKLHASAPPSPVQGSRDGKAPDDAPQQDSPHITLGGIEQVLYKDGQELETMLSRLQRARRIIICGCGTSWHAGLVGEYIFEQLCKVQSLSLALSLFYLLSLSLSLSCTRAFSLSRTHPLTQKMPVEVEYASELRFLSLTHTHSHTQGAGGD